MQGVTLAQSYSGTEFWFGVLENLFPSKTIQLMVVAEQSGSLTFTAPAQGFSTTYAYTAGATIINLNKSVIYPTAGAEVVDNKGGLINASNNIKIFILNEDAFSSDASPIVPFRHFLKGDQYIAQSLAGSPVFISSSFVIVSSKDNSQLSITPSAKTASGFSANSVINVTLNRGESFLVQAANGGDLSGSTIKSKNGCDKFVVFTGSKAAQSDTNQSTGCTGRDHLYSQLLPISHYGNTYYIAPFANQLGNYVVKITASEDNTQVFIDGTLLSTINKNQSFEYRPSLPNLKKSCVFTSKPSLVYQFMNSKGCNINSNGLGDPSMVFIPDRVKWTNKTSFGLFNSSNVSTHYINVVAHKNAFKTMIINGNVPHSKTIDTSLICNDIGVMTISTSAGFFNIVSDSQFYSYAYSVGDNESFAYLTGAEVFPYTATFNLMAKQACFNDQPIKFSIESDSLTVSKWTMGDGTTYNSNMVSHSYAAAGNYNASVIYKLKNNACENDTLTVPIKILPKVRFQGLQDSILCEGQKIAYRLSSTQLLTYQWQDGVIGSAREISNLGTYYVTGIDSNGCKSTDSFTLKDSGCYDKNLKLYNFFSPNGDGKNDEWSIEHQGYEYVNYFIFNRWGKEVFSGNAVESEKWDGLIPNTTIQCTEGTYFYHIEAKVLRTGKMEVVNGVITLLR